MAETIVSSLRLSIVIGASFADVITWRSDDVLVPFPGGTTAELIVRPKLYSDVVLAWFVTGSPSSTQGLITLVTPGVANLSMTAAKTALLIEARNAVFDIKYTFASGQVTVKPESGKGFCDIYRTVTRT